MYYKSHPLTRTSFFNNKIFTLLLVFTLTVLNEAIGYNKLGIVLASIEALTILLIVTFGNFVSGFILHIIFLLTALEWPADLLNKTPVFTYRTVELFGISISTLVLSLFFIYQLILDLKSNIKFKLRTSLGTSLLWLMLLTIIGVLTGIICVTLGEYKKEFFIMDFVYWITILFSTILFIKIIKINPEIIEYVEWIIISVLISRSLVKFFGIILGLYKGWYGGVEIFSFESIDYMIPLLIFSVKPQKKTLLRLTIIISWILGVIAAVIFESSGKGILLTLGVLIILIIKFLKHKKNLIIKIGFVSLAVLTFFLLSFKLIPILLEKYVLFSSKFNQAISLVSFSWIKDPYILPPSPQTRIIEFYNIIAYYLVNPIFLWTGRGFGGYFEDKAFYNYNANDIGGYSTEEVISRKFVRPHESLNNILLKFGIIGLLYYLYLLFKIFSLKKIQNIQISPFFKAFNFTIILLFLGYSLKLGFLAGLSISLTSLGGGTKIDNLVY